MEKQLRATLNHINEIERLAYSIPGENRITPAIMEECLFVKHLVHEMLAANPAQGVTNAGLVGARKLASEQCASAVNVRIPDGGPTVTIGAGGQAVDAPAVKALEWERVHDKTSEHIGDEAKTAIGDYLIAIDPFSYSPTNSYYVDGPQGFKLQCDTPEKAKAAAQADYEARIRSALTPAPSQPVKWEARRWSEKWETITADEVEHLRSAGWEVRPLYAPSQPNAEIERLTRERDEARDQRDYWRGRDKAGCEIEVELTAKLEAAESRAQALSAALEKALLWTDEENDVGEWRGRARRALNGEKAK